MIDCTVAQKDQHIHILVHIERGYSFNSFYMHTSFYCCGGKGTQMQLYIIVAERLWEIYHLLLDIWTLKKTCNP